MRRIEAVTGHAAQALIRERFRALGEVAATLGAEPTREGVVRAAEETLVRLADAQNALEALARDTARGSLDGLLATAQDVAGVPVIAAQVDAQDGDLLAEMADWLRDRQQSGVVVLGSEIGGKVRLVAKVTPDLVKRGVHAGKLVGAVAKAVGGGGGGRPDFATAGGRDADKLEAALQQTAGLVESALS